MCIFLILPFVVLLFFFEVHCVKRVELLLRGREVWPSVSSRDFVQGAGSAITAGVCPQHALVQTHGLTWVYIFCLRCVFIFYDFYSSNDLVLDHVIKLFIVLYRALKHGDFGWMLCVSGLWCSYYFLSLWGSQKGQNERTSVSAPLSWSYCCSWMARAVKSFIS